MIPLSDMLAPERVLFLKPGSKLDLINQLIDSCEGCPQVGDLEAFRNAVLDRERELSTGIGQGLAIPHAKIADVSDFVLAVGICREGVDFDSFDGAQIHFIVLIGAHVEQARDYIKVLAKVVKVFKEDSNKRALLNANSEREIHEFFQQF